MGAFVTTVEQDAVVFRLADPAHCAAAVSLWTDLHLPEAALAPVDGGWELRVVPPVDRIEYLLDVDGRMRLDPGNPRTVGGAFGDHSWLPLPGYREPAWLDVATVDGTRTRLSVDRTPVGTIDLELWTPADAYGDEPLPLLLAHDGPEMDTFGGLTHFVGAMVAAGRLPRMRLALLAPGPRNERYAANPAYARALTDHVLPALVAARPAAARPVLMGQSLGALAALHAAWLHPTAYAGVFCESGSFFTPELDPQESGFEYWAEVTGFVATVLTEPAPATVPVTLVCGTAEENLANNRQVAGRLAEQGLPVGWGEVRDGHTWTCWRDLLDPHLVDLLHRAWS